MSSLAEAFGDGSIELDVEVADWRGAIEAAGAALVASGRTRVEYTASMIRSVENNGPYIVIAPGVALAHAAISPEVLAAGFSLVRLRQPVEFGEAGDVALLFALAALASDSHAALMAEFAAWLTRFDQINFLLNAVDEAEIRRSF